MRDLHLDLNLRPRFRGGTHRSFIELTATQRIALAFDQSAHLLVQGLVALLEALLNLLNL